MKNLPWLPALLLAVLLPTLSHAQTAAESLAQVKKLSEQGNHREAADLGKAALAKPDATGELLEATVIALGKLDEDREAADVVELAVKAHPLKWDVLVSAGKAFSPNEVMYLVDRSFDPAMQLEHSGRVLDGRFYRGNSANGGEYKSVKLRDRVRSIQLHVAAWDLVKLEGTKIQKVVVLCALHNSFLAGQDLSSPTALLALTDISKLPDYDDQSGLDEPSKGYPVDENGDLIFFKAASTWETAKNDGERLLWINHALSELNPSDTDEIMSRAEMAAGWFSLIVT